MSFIAKRFRVFDGIDNVQLLTERPEGRLKSYSSDTDARSWSNSQQDRRQHILELISRDYIEPKCWGRYVPIPELFKILVKEKDIKIAELEEIINGLKGTGGVRASEKQDRSKTVGQTTEQRKKTGAQVAQGAQVAKGAQVAQGAKGAQGAGTSQIPTTGDRHAEEQQNRTRTGGRTADPTQITTTATIEHGPRVGLAADNVDNAECNSLLARAVRELETIRNIVINEDEMIEKEADIELVRQASQSMHRISTISERNRTLSELSLNEHDDLGSLKQRLIDLKNLPLQVRALKNKLGAFQKNQRHLQNQLRESFTESRKSIDLSQENRNLLEESKKLEKELENLRFKEQQSNCMRIELNCLRGRMEDFCRLQRDYEELKRRTRDYDDNKADLIYFKEKCEKFKQLQDDLQEMEEYLKQVENDRQLLREDIAEYESFVLKQKAEIEQLTCCAQELERQLGLKEEELSSKQEDTGKKDELLKKLQKKVEEYESELNSKNCEICCLKRKLHKAEEARAELVQKMEEKQGGDQHYQTVMNQTRTILRCLIERLRQDETSGYSA